MWNVAWVADALITHPRNLYHANIFYPHRNALAFSEANIGAGVLAVPAWALTGNPFAPQRRRPRRVRAGVRRRLLSGALPVGQPRGRGRGRRALRLLPVHLRAHGAHPAAVDGWLPFCCSRSIASSIGRRRCALGALGAVLWAQALSCAYYGIFAGLMVGLGTLLLRGHPRPVALGALLGRHRPRRVLARADAAVLPALPRGAGREGFAARSTTRGRTAPTSRPGWRRRPGRIAGGCRRSRLQRSAVSRASSTTVARRRRRGCVLRPSRPQRRTREPRRGSAATSPASTCCSRCSPSGRRSGPTPACTGCSTNGAGVRVPAGTGADGHHGDARPGGAVDCGPGAVAASRRRRGVALGGRWSLAGRARAHGAAARAVREAAAVPEAYRSWPGCRAARRRVPVLVRRTDFPRHAEYMLGSTYHWQPLVNGYSDFIPAAFRETVVPMTSFPDARVVRHPGRAGARYVVFHLNGYNRAGASADRTDAGVPAVPAPARAGGRRVALRNRRLAQLALVRGAGVVHTWPLAAGPAARGRASTTPTRR